MPVHAKNEDIRRQLRLKPLQPPLTHVAESRVVVAPLGVVIVRDDRHVEAERRKQIQALEPVRRLPDLIDLVHRDRVPAERQGSGAGHRHGPSSGQLLRQQPRDIRPGPLTERVGQTSGAGEHEPSVADADQRGLASKRIGVGGAERGH